MSSNEEWTVDVQGPNVVVTFGSGDDVERRVLTRRQARVLREQLYLGALLAGRNMLSEDAEVVDERWFPSSGVTADPDSDRERLEAIDRTARILTEPNSEAEVDAEDEADDDGTTPSTSAAPADSGAPDAGWGVPEGWNIFPEASRIHFEVPASAADDEFNLSRAEAAAIGIVLLWLAVPVSLREDLTDAEIASKWRSGTFRGIRPAEWAEMFHEPSVGFSDERHGGAE